MRLTSGEVVAIKSAAAETFGSGVIVRLFGSRLYDDRRGGDIDLLVQLPEGSAAVEAVGGFRRLLEKRVGERDYDILVAAPGQPISAVHRRAMAEGVVL